VKTIEDEEIERALESNKDKEIIIKKCCWKPHKLMNY